MARKLRIAVSVFFGVVAMALLVMWVRSYQWRDGFYGRIDGKLVHAISFEGEIEIAVLQKTVPTSLYTGQSIHTPADVQRRVQAAEAEMLAAANVAQNSGPQPFRVNVRRAFLSPQSTVIHTAYWTPLTLAAAFSIAPLVFWRFSLRALFVATTLVAVVLGMGVWVIR